MDHNIFNVACSNTVNKHADLHSILKPSNQIKYITFMLYVVKKITEAIFVSSARISFVMVVFISFFFTNAFILSLKMPEFSHKFMFLCLIISCCTNLIRCYDQIWMAFQKRGCIHINWTMMHLPGFMSGLFPLLLIPWFPNNDSFFVFAVYLSFPFFNFKNAA